MAIPIQAKTSCDKLASDCKESIEASRVEIKDLKLQVQNQTVLSAQLKEQRDTAYAEAEREADHKPWWFWAIAGLCAGVVLAKLK